MAVEHNGRGGSGVLEQIDNSVEALVRRCSFLVQGDPYWVEFRILKHPCIIIIIDQDMSCVVDEIYLLLDLIDNLSDGANRIDLFIELHILNFPLIWMLSVHVLNSILILYVSMQDIHAIVTNLVVLELRAPVHDFLGKGCLHLVHFFRVSHLDVVIEPLRLSGRVGLAIDIDDRLLSQIDPKHDLLVAILLQDGLQAVAKAFDGGLTSAKDWKTGQLLHKSIK